MWTRDSAQEFIEILWDALEPAGYFLGLTGSVLIWGESKKDLDLIVYPGRFDASAPAGRYTPDGDARLMAALLSVGLARKWDADFIRRRWREVNSACDKHVEGWFLSNPKRRVDLFFFP